MRLRTRLVAIVAAASLIPIGILGFGAARLAGSELEQTVNASQGRDAEGLAIYTSTWLDAQVELLRLQVASVPVPALPDAARTRFLQLVYQQTSAAGLVTLTDGAGADQAPPVRLRGDSASTAGRPDIDDTRLSRFRSALPLTRLNSGDGVVRPGAVLGVPYRPGDGPAVVPIAIPVPDSSMVLGVELELRPLDGRVTELGRRGIDVGVMAKDGSSVVDSPLGYVSAERLQSLLGTSSVAVRYLQDGVEVRAATAPVPGTDWTVGVAAPASEGAQAVRSIQTRTGILASMAAAIALLMGAVWASRLAAPVRTLRDAALSVAEGDLGRRVTPTGDREIAELARAFNFMSTRLERNANDIAQKNAEIEAFNTELQSRVEERTSQLRETQEQLLHSARLAAVGEMGAGLAHELNNPLAGILGITQVLQRQLADDKASTMLAALEREALRCTRIVGSLLGFSQELSGEHDPASERTAPFPLSSLLDDVMALVGPALQQRRLAQAVSVSSDLLVQAPRVALGRALTQLFTSVRSAAKAAGSFELEGNDAIDSVQLTVRLTSSSLDMGGDDWRATGLGLWAARRALSDVGGRLIEPRPEDAETGELVWRVVLPKVAE